MSRNLGQIVCYFCGGKVATVEAPRPASGADCFVYIDNYVGMLVANAECSDCKSCYLAWMTEPPRHARHFGPRDDEVRIRDLSFRSTFNDEPGWQDMPKFKVTVERWRSPLERERGAETASCVETPVSRELLSSENVTKSHHFEWFEKHPEYKT